MKSRMIGRILCLSFKEPRTMTNMFMRFQEYYESEKFKGQIVTRDEILRDSWERLNQDYYNTWEGFNVPVSIVMEFVSKTPKLYDEENVLVDLLMSSSVDYVIGYTSGDICTCNHEIAHGLYSTDTSYYSQVNQLLHGCNLSYLESILKCNNYDQSVYRDECQAYLVSGVHELGDTLYQKAYLVLRYFSLSKKVRRLYSEYSGDFCECINNKNTSRN